MCQKRPSMCQKRPSMCQKRPSMCQRRPIVCQRDLVYTSHDSDQKRPSMSQKRPSMISTDTLYFNIYQIYIYNKNTFNINSRIGWGPQPVNQYQTNAYLIKKNTIPGLNVGPGQCIANSWVVRVSRMDCGQLLFFLKKIIYFQNKIIHFQNIINMYNDYTHM